MAAGILVQRLDSFLSLKTFALSLAAFFAIFIAAIIAAGFLGEAPSHGIEKTMDIPALKTVAVKSGDLNQLDITTPPPKTPAVTQAGKAQPRAVKDAVAGLHETSSYGLAPVTRKEDGLTPFKAYAAQFTPDPDAKAPVSLVMVDFGLSAKTATAAIGHLPEGVSFAIDPYVKDAQKFTGNARKYNHEIWLSLPVQPGNYPATDPGPKTILAKMSDAESNKRLLQTLSIATGYTGVIVDNGAAFMSGQEHLQKILSSVSDRGPGIIESDPADRITGPLAAQTKAPYGQADFWIDGISSEKDLQSKFIEIEAAAVKNKKIIVFFRPYPATLKAIQSWAAAAANRGVQLAPLSFVVSK